MREPRSIPDWNLAPHPIEPSGPEKLGILCGAPQDAQASQFIQRKAKPMETYFPNMQDAPSKQARERMMADLQALASDAEALLRATADDASEKAKEARTRITAALERAKATYAELQEQTLESAKAAVGKADETIRAHPYESIAVAFGVGLLLGALLRRK